MEEQIWDWSVRKALGHEGTHPHSILLGLAQEWEQRCGLEKTVNSEVV
jgi:hypothetical protein